MISLRAGTCMMNSNLYSTFSNMKSPYIILSSIISYVPPKTAKLATVLQVTNASFNHPRPGL
jgi:hypothetical protein